MQKVVQRAERAHRVAARKFKKEAEHLERAASWERGETFKRLQKSVGQRIREARQNRAVDWETGPLAPRRDVGDAARTYGAIGLWDLQLPEVDPSKRPKWIHISEGDRVVVTRGREKGKIGVVRDIDRARVGVRVEGVNRVDVSIPEWVQQEDQRTEDLMGIERHIPLEDVKLVYPLPDPSTGVPRDVIIDRLTRINFHYDKIKKEWTDGDRLVPGTNTIIPWPEKSDEQFEDHEDDTLRMTVEEQTFRPFLLHPPMPLSVIDELRNKYSRFRTRHDWDYIEKKELEGATEEKRKELIKGMRTPLQELADVRKQRTEAQQKELTDVELAKIGEVMAQEMAKTQRAVRQISAAEQ